MRIEWSTEVYDELRHFFVGGALQEPSPFRLALPEGPMLAFFGQGVEEREEGCSVDLGLVTAIGESHRSLRVESLGEKPVWVEAASHEPSIQTGWAGTGERAVRLSCLGDTADLEVIFNGDAPLERTMSGRLRLTASLDEGEPRTYDIRVGLCTQMNVPFGRYDLQGAAEPSLYDLGAIDPAEAGPDSPAPYTVTIEPVGPVPLRIWVEDLPPWMIFELDGYVRRGPAPGPFFEREAPVRFSLRPMRSFKYLGAQRASIILRTNDVRPEWRRREIDLVARIESARAYLYAAHVSPVRLEGSVETQIEIPLSNWGKAPARLSLADKHDALEVGSLPVVPGAEDSVPGREVLQIAVSGDRLPSGESTLGLTFHVDGGSPAILEIPVRVYREGISVTQVPRGSGLAPVSGAAAEPAPGILEAIIAIVLWAVAILLWAMRLA